jgi:two-component system response regulator QseB
MGAAVGDQGESIAPHAVLLIEDDPRIADFMIRGLRASGFSVDWVTTGTEGLARLAAGGVDVQILDLGLPDMDGLDLLRRLTLEGIDVVTVVVTARTDPNDRRLAESLGADHYITKPFAWADLISAVRAGTRLPID